MSAAADIACSIDDVDKIYQRRGKAPVHAVKALSMRIHRGETVALLGSSGCGKTSTLRMIAGFEDVTRGAITLAGRRIEALPPAARRVAMAFEGYSLYPPLTLRDNIAFALKAQKLGRAEADRRVGDVAEMLDITGILDRYPSSVSGGQQQRASLARALVRQADLYLLDEPMGQLEPQLRAILRGRLKSLLQHRGMTAIFVTHDQTEANALADRIAVMEGGVLQQFGTPAELKDVPANLFVATFIGEPPMNVFDARVGHGDGGFRFVVDGGPSLAFSAGEVEPALAQRLAGRERVVLGVRPHRIRIGSGPQEAKVVSNQWLGDQSHVAAEVAGHLMVAVAHDRVPVKPGASIRYDVALGDVHLFDPDSGAAIAHGARAA
jgi:multiple sugar transport system ATP-binding protein